MPEPHSDKMGANKGGTTKSSGSSSRAASTDAAVKSPSGSESRPAKADSGRPSGPERVRSPRAANNPRGSDWKAVVGIEWDMEDSLRHALAQYIKLAESIGTNNVKFKAAPTPILK